MTSPVAARCLPLLAAALLLLLGTSVAQASDVTLRNSSLAVQAAECAPTPNVTAVQAAIVYVGGPTPARADFTQAYLCPDGLSLCNGLSVLEPYATIEANNSYIVANTSNTPPGTVYESLDLQLLYNNTLAIDGATNLTFDRSTLRLTAWNWFTITNSSLYMHSSRLDFTDHFLWAVRNSALKVNYSILEHRDVAVEISDSDVQLNDLTWNIFTGAAAAPPSANISYGAAPAELFGPAGENITATGIPGAPTAGAGAGAGGEGAPGEVGGTAAGGPVSTGLYGAEAIPAVWIDGSTVTIRGSRVVVSSVPFVMSNSSLVLNNTALHFYNTTASLWSTNVTLFNSTIVLHDRSTLELYCNSTVGHASDIVNATVNGIPTDILDGAPVGSKDVAIQDAPEAVITLVSPQELATPSRAPPAGAPTTPTTTAAPIAPIASGVTPIIAGTAAPLPKPGAVVVTPIFEASPSPSPAPHRLVTGTRAPAGEGLFVAPENVTAGAFNETEGGNVTVPRTTAVPRTPEPTASVVPRTTAVPITPAPTEAVVPRTTAVPITPAPTAAAAAGTPGPIVTDVTASPSPVGTVSPAPVGKVSPAPAVIVSPAPAATVTPLGTPAPTAAAVVITAAPVAAIETASPAPTPAPAGAAVVTPTPAATVSPVTATESPAPVAAVTESPSPAAAEVIVSPSPAGIATAGPVTAAPVAAPTEVAASPSPAPTPTPTPSPGAAGVPAAELGPAPSEATTTGAPAPAGAGGAGGTP